MIREQTSIGKQLHQFVATQFLSVGLSTLVECQRCQTSAQITLVHRWCRSDRLWILCRQNLAQISFCYFLCIFYVLFWKWSGWVDVMHQSFWTNGNKTMVKKSSGLVFSKTWLCEWHLKKKRVDSREEKQSIRKEEQE